MSRFDKASVATRGIGGAAILAVTGYWLVSWLTSLHLHAWGAGQQAWAAVLLLAWVVMAAVVGGSMFSLPGWGVLCVGCFLSIPVWWISGCYLWANPGHKNAMSLLTGAGAWWTTVLGFIGGI